MKVRLSLSGLTLAIALLSYVESGVIEISAYGNASKPSTNSSVESTGTSRTMTDDAGFQNIFNGLPVSYASSSQNSHKVPKYIVYPSNSKALLSQPPTKEAMASDRFTPGEAYGGTIYKILKAKHEKRKGYQYQKPNAASLDDSKTIPSSAPPPPESPSSPPPLQNIPPSIIPPSPPPLPPPPFEQPQLPPVIAGPTPLPPTATPKPSESAPPSDSLPATQYIPPSDPNLFAPNIHSHYPPPPANSETRFNGITSYLPPPAGPVEVDSAADSSPLNSPPSNQYIPPAELFQFPPNIHSHYYPPPMGTNFQMNGLTSYLPPPAGPTDTYLPPSSEADSPPPNPPSSADSSDDTIGTIAIGPDTPYPGYLPPTAPQSPAPPAPQPQMMMAMPPAPNMMMNIPPSKDAMMPMPVGSPMSDHPMDLPFYFHGYDNYYPHDHYPEYIFDHDHDHHHHEEPPSTTTPASPPPPQPVKIKNYSYYKISRTLWYIPLFFTLYFLTYILILILRSVARRKVSYPNKFQARGFEITEPLDAMRLITNEQAMEKANMMTHFVISQIEDFKSKYVD